MTTAIDTTKIRDLNDALRRTGVGGRMLLTAGIGALPVQHQVEILMRVRAHDEFTEDNDPHGEHDFGSLEPHFLEDRLLRPRHLRQWPRLWK